jgi:hypothetical protein
MTSSRRGLVATLDAVARVKLLSGQVEVKRFPAAPIVLLVASGLIVFAATGLHGYPGPSDAGSPLNDWFLQAQVLYAWLCVVAYFLWLYLVARPSTRRPVLTTPAQLILVTAGMAISAIVVGVVYFSPAPTAPVPSTCQFPISHLPCVTGIVTNSAFWAAANLGLILLVVISTVLRVGRRMRGQPIETGLFFEKPDVSDVLAGDTLGLAAWCAGLAFLCEPARVVSLVRLSTSPVPGQTPEQYVAGILTMPPGWPAFESHQPLYRFDQDLALYCALIGLSFLAISAVLTLLRKAHIVEDVEIRPEDAAAIESPSGLGRLVAGLNRTVERLTDDQDETPSAPVLALAFILKLIGMFLDAIGRFIGLGANNLISVLRNGVWPLLIPASLLLFAVASDNIRADLHLISSLHSCPPSSKCYDPTLGTPATATQYYVEALGSAVAATLVLVFAAALSLAGRTLKEARALTGNRRTDLAVLADLISAAVGDSWLAAFVLLVTLWLLDLTLYLVNLILNNRHVTDHTPFTELGSTFRGSLAALVAFAVLGLLVVLPRRRKVTSDDGDVQP